MKTFCQTCGTANEYAAVRPNFCFSCGGRMGGSTASAPPPQPAPSQRPVYRPEPEDDWQEDYSDIVNPQDLGFSIASSRTPVKMEDVFGQGASDWGGNRKKITKADYKNFLENTIKKTKKIDIDGK